MRALWNTVGRMCFEPTFAGKVIDLKVESSETIHQKLQDWITPPPSRGEVYKITRLIQYPSFPFGLSKVQEVITNSSVLNNEENKNTIGALFYDRSLLEAVIASPNPGDILKIFGLNEPEAGLIKNLFNDEDIILWLMHIDKYSWEQENKDRIAFQTDVIMEGNCDHSTMFSPIFYGVAAFN